MNTQITPTLDLESLRKAIREYQPDPSRIPFNNLKPFHDSIVELRGKNASYAAIAELLEQHGVKTSRARVAEYGRIVLEGGKSRKRRKRARTAPAVNAPATPQSAPAIAAKPTPATPAPTPAPAGNVTPPPKEDSPYRSRGPHIANVKMMTPSEREEFEASLKSKPQRANTARKAIRRCASIAMLPGAAARAPNKQASDVRQPHAATKVRTPPRQANNATIEASFFRLREDV